MVKKNTLLTKSIQAINSKIYWKIYAFFIDKTFQPKVSYSQNGEDIIVHSIFQTLLKPQIFYIDVGGYHPYVGNNTILFYQAGSNGIVIEPNPELFVEFPKKRPRDINLNIGVSIISGEQPFYLPSSGALGSFVLNESDTLSFNNKEVDPINVQVKTLNDIINEHAKGKIIDYISMDIEGLELPVLQSMDFSTVFPTVLCVETIGYSTGRQKVKRYDIIRFLEEKGYFVYADTYINTIFVRTDIWKVTE